MKRLDWRLNPKIVTWCEVLEAMLNQRKVVHPKKSIILKQLCLLLMLAYEILRIIEVSITWLHHSLHLISMAIVLHHDVVVIYLVVNHSMMLSDHVLLLLYYSLMWVIITVLLHILIHYHRVLRRGCKRFTMMVVHSKLIN